MCLSMVHVRIFLTKSREQILNKENMEKNIFFINKQYQMHFILFSIFFEIVIQNMKCSKSVYKAYITTLINDLNL